MTMRVLNEQRNITALVEKYVGTAFDQMANLNANIPALLELLNELTHFNDSWLGVQSTPPETRLNGDPLENGDRYFDENTLKTFVWANGIWVDGSGQEFVTDVENVTVETGDINVGFGTTTITLTTPYTTNANAIHVFLNGTHQASGIHYSETNETTITFNEELDENELVTVISGLPVPTLNPNIKINTMLYIGETTDQTLIPLPGGMTYAPDQGNIKVHVNGSLLFSGLDYTETSPTSITVSTPIQPGDRVVFEQGEIIQNHDLDKQVQVIPLHLDFYENRDNLNTAWVTLTKGGNTVGDGSGGMYVYDETYEKAQANGVTVIDADVEFGDQGTGSGFGCWVRQYEGQIHPEWWNTPARGMAMFRTVTPKEGDWVNILGFYEGTEQDNGYIFVWKPTTSASLHDGATIISPAVTADPGTAPWYVAPVGAPDGCWLRQDNRSTMLHGDWWGIKRSGFDTTDAWTALAFWLSTHTKPALIPSFPNYQVTGTITIDANSTYSFGPVGFSSGGLSNPVKDIMQI
jgi:hypothetical protein